jgi:uncharacterized membrane protein
MIWESIIAAIVVLVVLAIPATVIILGYLALARTEQIAGLLRRVNDLEREVRRLKTAPARPLASAEREPVHVENAQEMPTTVPEVIPVVLPAAKAEPSETEMLVEQWIGSRALGWIAVVLLVFAVGFFLRYIFENDLIGPLGRVGIGLGLGLALCASGLRYHRRGWWIFAQFLTAGGIVLLYLSTYASFGYYNLLPREPAAGFLIVIIVEAVALAILYDAPSIAIMAVLGGLLTPLLLRTDQDQYRSLFPYLLLLDAGFVGLTVYRAWPAIATIALVGTQLLFWGWFGEHYHPEKRGPALAFQTVLFILFLAHPLAIHVGRRRLASAEDLVRLPLHAVLFLVALFVLVRLDYEAWRGTLAMVLALIYPVIAWWIAGRQQDDVRLLFVVVAVAMGLVATAIAREADAAWIALGWAVQGAALWWFGLRVCADAPRGLGFGFLVLAVWRLVLVDTSGAHPVPFVPLFNKYGLPATMVAVALVVAALASRRYMQSPIDLDFVAMRVLGLGGVTLLWFVLSFETYQYFQAQSAELKRTQGQLVARRDYVRDPDRWPKSFREVEDAEAERAYQQLVNRQAHLQRSAQTSLSVLWAVYAALVLTAGFRLASRPLRWFALGLFGLTLLKVALVDTANLRGLYRVAAFLALSVMMGLGAWAYQRVRQVLLVSDNKETTREMV